MMSLYFKVIVIIIIIIIIIIIFILSFPDALGSVLTSRVTVITRPTYGEQRRGLDSITADQQRTVGLPDGSARSR